MNPDLTSSEKYNLDLKIKQKSALVAKLNWALYELSKINQNY